MSAAVHNVVRHAYACTVWLQVTTCVTCRMSRYPYLWRGQKGVRTARTVYLYKQQQVRCMHCVNHIHNSANDTTLYGEGSYLVWNGWYLCVLRVCSSQLCTAECAAACKVSRCCLCISTGTSWMFACTLPVDVVETETPS